MNPVVTGRIRKPFHRHTLPINVALEGDTLTHRYSCGHEVDYDARKRGKTSRNYGNRAELAASRQYGGRKVGHAQGPTDIVGTVTKTQLKTKRGEAPAMWRREFAKLDVERDGRLPRLLLRFVRPGNVGPDDYFVIRGRDYLEWFGRDE